MALDAVKDRLRTSPLDRGGDKAVSDFLKSRIGRGRERLQTIAPYRDEAFEFYRGNHYAYVDENNKVQFLPTVTTARRTGKPSHRVRQARNLLFDVVLREAARAHVAPSYSVVPSTGDPDDAAAASLAEKIAIFGHDRWNVRRTAVDAVIHAVVTGEAFAWPYFDNTIGPFIGDSGVGVGDIRIKVFGANECYWEPGLRFEDSPWHVVEQARPVDQVKSMPGFLGGDLTPDADSRQLSMRGKRKATKKLILVTEYLERPCPDYPPGRWITIANNHRILEDRDYPGDGQEPVLRPLRYAPDPDSDRSLGLVPQLIDAMRSFESANNKAHEWMYHCIFPRVFVTPGLMKKQRWTDEPGKVYEIPDPERNVKMYEAPEVPSSLHEMADRAHADIGRIAAQGDPPPGTESGKAFATWNEHDRARGALFLADLAQFYSWVMHDCLVLVQRHYSEPRLVQIKGDFGWEPIEDFKGAQLRDQVDVRVLPESIEPITRQAQEQRIMNFVQMGAIDPQQGMAAIEMGSAERVTRSLSLDESRAGRIIRRIKDGTIFGQRDVPTGRLVPKTFTDPTTGEEFPDPSGEQEPEMAPWWMPRYSDNVVIFKATFEDWMKTEDYENLEEEMQQAAAQVYGAILQLEAQKAAEAQMAQMAQAEQLGRANAARPQAAKPLGSFPAMNGGSEQGAPGA